MGVNFPNVLVVNADLKIRSFADYVAYARANPGKLDFASTGPASASHLAGELLNDMARIETVHVPYKGGAPAMVDVVSGQVASYYSTLSTALPHIESGRVIPLASTGLRRLASLPKVPTIAESGFPGYSATELVCVPGLVQGAQADTRSLERRTGEGAAQSRRRRATRQPRAARSARHPR
jgi:tripartite-type tricarboxylate transporter receptor subunit TctC